MCASSDLLEIRREAVESLRPASLVSFAVRSRFETFLRKCHLRLRTLFFERHRDEHLSGRVCVPDQRVGGFFGRHNFTVNPVLPHVRSIGGGHLGPPFSPSPLIHFQEW